jgi:hypothetical protein
MTYKKGQWVRIRKGTYKGKIGQISVVCDDNKYSIEVDGIYINLDGTFGQWQDSQLEPAPKTWDTLEKGDVITNSYDNYDTKSVVLEIVGDSFLKSNWENFEKSGDWLTKKQAQDNGWKLKGASEKVVEMTVEEVSKAVGKTVKIVKGK